MELDFLLLYLEHLETSSKKTVVESDVENSEKFPRNIDLNSLSSLGLSKSGDKDWRTRFSSIVFKDEYIPALICTAN